MSDNTTLPLAVIVLAAGQGSRMQSKTSKVLHKLAGWPLIRHVLTTAHSLLPERVVLVTSTGAEDIVAEAQACEPSVLHAVQEQACGTADAVRAAMSHLDGFSGRVLVLYGDTPLMTTQTLEALLATLNHYDLAITGMEPEDPAQYGRLLQDAQGDLQAIIEYREASPEQRGITLCNAGVMAMDMDVLHTQLPRIEANNAKGEYYLTDLVSLCRESGKRCGYMLAAEEEMLGINTRAELAACESRLQQRLRRQMLESGVGMIAPETVFFAMDTRIGRDTVIHPYVTFLTGVTIGEGADIRSFSQIEGAVIADRTSIGPYARLRPGTTIGPRSAIGNFVETKNVTLHEGVKAGHLSYLGDAEIGSNTNIGAGTITCNYDGKEKHHTHLGSDVFVGSDTAFVAPVSVGDGATIGAGSVITKDVPEYALSLARTRQVIKPDWLLKNKP